LPTEIDQRRYGPNACTEGRNREARAAMGGAEAIFFVDTKFNVSAGNCSVKHPNIEGGWLALQDFLPGNKKRKSLQGQGSDAIRNR